MLSVKPRVSYGTRRKGTRRKRRNRRSGDYPRKPAVIAAGSKLTNTRMGWALYITSYRLARSRGMTLQGLIRHLLTLYAASVLGHPVASGEVVEVVGSPRPASPVPAAASFNQLVSESDAESLILAASLAVPKGQQ